MTGLLREGLALCDEWAATHPAMAERTRRLLREKAEAGELTEQDLETLRSGVRVTQQAREEERR